MITYRIFFVGLLFVAFFQTFIRILCISRSIFTCLRVLLKV